MRAFRDGRNGGNDGNGGRGGVLVSIFFLEGESRGNVDGGDATVSAQIRSDLMPTPDVTFYPFASCTNDTADTDLIDICNTTPDS